jgi:hypothetical protein
MKLVKFETVQEEFVRQVPRNMTIDDVMRKIAQKLTNAIENDGKGKGRTGRFVSFNPEKGKVYIRIKYGPAEVFCLEDVAKTPAEANDKVVAYATSLAAGSVSSAEKEAIRKAMIARQETMGTARAARRAKKAS